MTRTPLKLLLFCTLVASSAQAKDRWSGSTISYRNTVSVLSLDKSAELTYNPYYAMSFTIAPRVWFTDMGYVSARVSLSREITDSDLTTRSGEWWASDLSVRVGAASFYTIPVLGLAFSADLDLTAPTSPVSQARTMRIGVGPGVSARRHFDVLSGFTIGYGFRATFRDHRFTTAEREVPLIPGSDLLSTGLRNPQWRLVHALDLGFHFTEWMTLSLSGALITDYLYPLTAGGSAPSFVPTESQDKRYAVSTDISLSFTPHNALSITLGASTTNPQLAPDSSARTPFYNRYTVVYLDLGLNIAGLLAGRPKSRTTTRSERESN